LAKQLVEAANRQDQLQRRIVANRIAQETNLAAAVNQSENAWTVDAILGKPEMAFQMKDRILSTENLRAFVAECVLAGGFLVDEAIKRFADDAKALPLFLGHAQIMVFGANVAAKLGIEVNTPEFQDFIDDQATMRKQFGHFLVRHYNCNDL
jgi:hypothetical protein